MNEGTLISANRSTLDSRVFEMGFPMVLAACLWFIVFFSGTLLLAFSVGWIGVYIWWAGNILLAISLNTAIRHSEPEAFDDRLSRERREVARERYIAEILKPRQKQEAAQVRHFEEMSKSRGMLEERQEAAIQRYKAGLPGPGEKRGTADRRYTEQMLLRGIRRRYLEIGRALRNRPYSSGILWSVMEAILISTNLFLATFVLWIVFGFIHRDVETSLRAFLFTQPLALGLGFILMYLVSPSIFADPVYGFFFLVGMIVISVLLGGVGSALGSFAAEYLKKPD